MFSYIYVALHVISTGVRIYNTRYFESLIKEESTLHNVPVISPSLSLHVMSSFKKIWYRTVIGHVRQL